MDFLNTYQLLIASILLPALTLIVTVMVNHSAEKRAAKDRKAQLELSHRMKLADFRQNWINEIRKEFSVICSNVAVVGESTLTIEQVRDINNRITNVLLMMNPRETSSQGVYTKLMDLLNKPNEDKENIAFELVNLVNIYLKSEWERLKAELSEYDERIN